MTTRKPVMVTCLLALGVALVAARPASAMSCPKWARLSSDQKYAAISRMIDDAIKGHGGRQYNVNRNAIGRCLDSMIDTIFFDFEDTCADSRGVSKQTLNNHFKSYIWHCAG